MSPHEKYNHDNGMWDHYFQPLFLGKQYTDRTSGEMSHSFFVALLTTKKVLSARVPFRGKNLKKSGAKN